MQEREASVSTKQSQPTDTAAPAEAGRFLAVDSYGYFRNDCSPNILLPWREAVEEIARAYRCHLQGRLHSAYLRGSVARGTARLGISDIDTFAIVRGSITKPDIRWQKETELQFRLRYAYAEDIELQLFSTSGLARDPSRTNMFFFVKTMSICICGVDLAPLLPAFRPSPTIAVHLPELEKSIRRAQTILQTTEDPALIARLCRWIMKSLVRSGFELIIEREHAYTRDLVSCAERFGKHYPSRASSMNQACKLAMHPSDLRDEVLAILAELGDWILQEAATLAYKHPSCGSEPMRFEEAENSLFDNL